MIQQRPFSNQQVTADEMIQAMQQIIDRSHAHGIKVLVAPSQPIQVLVFIQRMAMLFVQSSTDGFAPAALLTESSILTKPFATRTNRIDFFRLINREIGCIPAMQVMLRW